MSERRRIDRRRWHSAYAATMEEAQRLERELLRLLLTARRYEDAEGAIDDFERVLAGDLKKPLGAVLRALAQGARRTRARLEADVESAFQYAVDVRNFVAHDYFKVRLLTPEHEKVLLDELRRFQVLLAFAARLAKQLYTKLSPSESVYADRRILVGEVEHYRERDLKVAEAMKVVKRLEQAFEGRGSNA